MWFDSHCHLDFEAFDADRDELVARARLSGVEGLFVPGVRPGQWPRLGRLRRRFERIAVGVGLHPYFLHELREGQLLRALDELPQWYRTTGAVAVGECGLDARTAKAGGADLDRQERVLEAHVELARLLNAPLVLHVVHAHGRALSLLERTRPVAGGVLHSYSGSAELVKRYERLGFHFGFSGRITQPSANKVRAALAAVPMDRLLVETDAPDQVPHGWGATVGEARNEPAAVAHIGAVMAELRGVSCEALAEITTRNARRLYGV